jgi:hypothetical protein
MRTELKDVADTRDCDRTFVRLERSLLDGLHVIAD